MPPDELHTEYPLRKEGKFLMKKTYCAPPLCVKDVLEVAYRTIGPDSRIGQEHFDNSIEIFQFWSSGGYFIAKGNIYPITPGTVVLANAIHPHYSNPTQIATYNRSKIVINYEFFLRLSELCGITEYADRLFLHNGGLMLSADTNNFNPLEMDALFRQAALNFPIGPEPDLKQAHVVDALLRILIAVFSHASDAPQKKADTTTLHRLAEYLNRPINSYTDFSLESLCQQLYISPSYASHLFKKLTNQSISHYIMELRISEAKKLLLTTDMKVRDIAEHLQFADSTTFCKTFKKHTHCTPNDYRKTSGISLNAPE